MQLEREQGLHAVADFCICFAVENVIMCSLIVFSAKLHQTLDEQQREKCMKHVQTMSLL